MKFKTTLNEEKIESHYYPTRTKDYLFTTFVDVNDLIPPKNMLLLTVDMVQNISISTLLMLNRRNLIKVTCWVFFFIRHNPTTSCITFRQVVLHSHSTSVFL